jgi:hypothetical protein
MNIADAPAVPRAKLGMDSCSFVQNLYFTVRLNYSKFSFEDHRSICINDYAIDNLIVRSTWHMNPLTPRTIARQLNDM